MRFKTTGPLDYDQDRAIYVSRPERREILKQIRQPYVDSYLALLGSRQTGKTTLLYRLYREIKLAGEPVAFLDLSAYRVESMAQSYAHAALKIWEELGDNLAASGKLRALAGGVDGPIRFREFMLELARQCRGTRIVVLLDEVGSFMSNSGFFETVRSISTSGGHDSEQAFKKYFFVFSGAVDLHELTSGQNSPLANVCRPIYLSDFDLAGTEYLVANLAQVAPLAPRLAAYVHEQARGHPYLTQRICALIEQSAPTGQIAPRDVDRAIEQMHEGDGNLRYIAMQIGRYPQARELLRQMMIEGRRVPFSLLDPRVARLFIIGAIRREKVTQVVDGTPRERSLCAIRNPIYDSALRRYFEMLSFYADEPPTPVVNDSATPLYSTGRYATDGMVRLLTLPPAVDPRDYLDFHLHVHSRPDDGSPPPVTVESWAGSGAGDLAIDLHAPQLRDLLGRLERNCALPDDLCTLGTLLWQSLFASVEIARRYAACQAEAAPPKGVRIKLTVEPPELAALPWEYLYDPEAQSFPALSPRTPITRYTHPRQQDPPPLAFAPPLRILLVSAEPDGHGPVGVDAEREQIVGALARLQRAGKVEIETLDHATVRTLQAMLRRPFHVLHYIGHGAYDERTGNGMLLLEDEEGGRHALSAAQLQYLLRDTTVRLAVFNACLTARGAAGRSIAEELMHAGLAAALGMQFAISEHSATIFAGEFYRTLADGWPVDAAVAEGRKAVMFATDLNVMDWGVPVLFMRTREGILFRRTTEQEDVT